MEVNEEGTEAAAATGIQMTETARMSESKPLTFRDRPPVHLHDQGPAVGEPHFYGQV